MNDINENSKDELIKQLRMELEESNDTIKQLEQTNNSIK